MDAIESTGRGGFLLSCIFHAGIIAVVVFGPPVFLRHKAAVPQPVAVHIVDVAALPAPFHHDAAPGPDKAGGIVGQPALLPITGRKDAAHDSQTTGVAAPDKDGTADSITRPQPQQWVERATSVLTWATDKLAAAPPVKPSQVVEKTAPSQDPPRPPDTVAAIAPAPPPSIDDQMDSLVKSLSDQATALEAKRQAARRHRQHNADREDIVDEAPPPQRLASRLTADEIDKVREQVRGCWAYFGNADRVRGVQVPIHLVLRPDGSIVSARIVDDGHEDDPLWRSVADSALRALQNPNCSPLALPPAKYDAWRSATFTFSP